MLGREVARTNMPSQEPGSHKQGELPMSQTTFYVLDNGVPPKLVAAKYLYYNGAPVADPNASAKQTEIYNANGSLFGFDAAGYLIVPADYNLSNAMSFASSVAKAMAVSNVGPKGEAIKGLASGMAMMTKAFLRGGSQDLQRTYNGTTNGPFVPAFVDAASFNLGVITAYAGIPLKWSEAGGGYNLMTSIGRTLQNKPPLNTGGALGLSQANTQSVQAGYTFGQMLPGAPPPAEANPPKINIIPSTGDFFTSAFIIPTTGSAIELALNPTSGGSQEWLFNVGNGVADEGSYYSAANETGSLEHENLDFVSGSSEEESFTGLAAGLSVKATLYTGTNRGVPLPQGRPDRRATQPRLYVIQCPIRRTRRPLTADRRRRPLPRALLVALEGTMDRRRPTRPGQTLD